MGFLLFIITAGALVILTAPLLKQDKYKNGTIGAIILSSTIIVINGTYRACRDGWASHSIGNQGACSWHRGVVTKLSDLGWIILAASLLVIGVWYFYSLYKEKKKEKKSKNQKG